MAGSPAVSGLSCLRLQTYLVVSEPASSPGELRTVRLAPLVVGARPRGATSLLSPLKQDRNDCLCWFTLCREAGTLAAVPVLQPEVPGGQQVTERCSWG